MSALGLDLVGPISASGRPAATARSAPPEAGVGKWLPWLIVVFAAIIFLPQLRGCGAAKVDATKPVPVKSQ